MPSFLEHEEQAISNINFISDVCSALVDENGNLKYPDWYVTGAFYAAVHVIESELYKMNMIFYTLKGVPGSTTTLRHSSVFRPLFEHYSLPTSPHFVRAMLMSDPRNEYDDDVKEAYNCLYEYSCKARYECYKGHKNVKRSLKHLKTIVDFHKSKFESAIQDVGMSV